VTKPKGTTAKAGVAAAQAMAAHNPTVIAIGSTAMGTATAPILDAGELRQAATEYNIGRTAETSYQLPVAWEAAEGLPEPVIAVPKVALTANAQRVASIVMGSWVASGSAPGCDPDIGQHEEGCGHRANRVTLSRYAMAMDTFDAGGGSQLRQVDTALDELYDEGTEYLVHDARTGARLRQRGRILELTDLRRTEQDDVLYEVRFGAYLLDSIMAGHYQSFPVQLVQGLSGADFLTWLAVLTQPWTGKLTKAGQYAAYNVGGGRRGRKAAIDPARLGLGRQRRDKLRASLERAAVRGTLIVEPLIGLKLAVEDRADGSGPQLVLTRTIDRAKLRHLDRQSRTPRPAIEDTSTGNVGRDGRQSRTRFVRESVPVDAMVRHDSERRASRAGARETEPSSAIAEPDIAALQERGWPVSEKQRRTLDEIADRHGREWAADIIRDTPKDVDPLRAVWDADATWQTDKRAKADAADAEWQATKAAEASGAKAIIQPEASPVADVAKAMPTMKPRAPEPDPETTAARREIAERLRAEGGHDVPDKY
jgi:hypothetical protein